MVVAHLQGLLSAHHSFGARSSATEEIMFEAIHAQMLASNMSAGVEADLALIPVLTQKGVVKTSDSATARLGRVAELRLMDIYKVADQISGKLKLSNPQRELSLFQLYQIAEKTGIFDELDEHYTVENSRPLL